MVSAEESTLRLDGLGQSAGRARRWVRAVLADLGALSLLEAAELGLTELVTNACLHARTPVQVTARAVAGRIRFEVTDGSPILPLPARRGAGATTGRGMYLVAACGAWGVVPEAGGVGKTVWFEPTEAIAEQAPVDAGWAADIEELR